MSFSDAVAASRYGVEFMVVVALVLRVLSPATDRHLLRTIRSGTHLEDLNLVDQDFCARSSRQF